LLIDFVCTSLVAMRLASISIDLDEIGCYTAIHGLAPVQSGARHAVYRKAVPRIEAWLDGLGVRATFFAIGADLADEGSASAIVRLHRSGHEIANHSFQHRYDFTRQNEVALRGDIVDGGAAIKAVTGTAPIGFRAPGYTIVDGVFAALQSLSYGYDSSVFPCPSYYAAKALAIGAIAVRGRNSHSIIDDPRVLSAPADPYCVGRPYYRRGSGLVELPIGVTSNATGRLPFIGTSLVLAGKRGAAGLSRCVVGRPLVNLELHGIDFCDAEADGLQFLAPHQPDLRRPAAEKRETLGAAITVLQQAGYEFATLAQAADRFRPILQDSPVLDPAP
jgi:hypothetical protein